MTLNNYINQRHLAFAIALGFVLYAVVWQSVSHAKRISWHIIVLMGASVGLLFYWNVVICIAIAISIFILCAVYKQIKAAIVFACTLGIVVVLSLIPYIPKSIELFSLVQLLTTASLVSQRAWSFWTYLWENFGLLPFVAGVGYMALGKRRKPFFPMIMMFILLILFAGYQHRGFDQKLLSMFIIPINLLAAIGLLWIWNKRSLMTKFISLFLFFVLTVSGGVDLLVVKNEFAFPIISSENISVISWIQQNTSKDAVFVSYSDMIDPVVLAGRKNYFGFFGNVGWTDRSLDVKNIYAGDADVANNLGISYILVPKWNKSDFPYVVDLVKLRQLYEVSYEDERFVIFSTTRN